MALSNIFNEPRREITETLVGIGALFLPVTIFCFVDYYFAIWLSSLAPGTDAAPPFPIALLFLCPISIVALCMIAYMIAIFIHHVGELVCDMLDDGGLHLRPRRAEREGR